MPNSPNPVKAQLAKPSHSPLPHTGVGARNYKTVRLSRGKHRSPEEGVCVMELASMLTGAVFSDRVYRVDPAISAFLWGYNDRIDDNLRQDLHPYAAAVLGTSRGVEVAERRAQLCRIWARHLQSARSWRLPWALRFRRCAPVDLLDASSPGSTRLGWPSPTGPGTTGRSSSSTC